MGKPDYEELMTRIFNVEERLSRLEAKMKQVENILGGLPVISWKVKKG